MPATDLTKPQRIGDLEIEQDLEFQHRCWRLERVGWVVMTLILLAALAGLIGTGPLSHGVAGDPNGALRVEYQRCGRLVAPEEMRIHVGPGQARDGRVTIWVDRAYVEQMDVQRVTPDPITVKRPLRIRLQRPRSRRRRHHLLQRPAPNVWNRARPRRHRARRPGRGIRPTHLPMNTVLRAAAIYLALLVIFRITGKRSLAQITSFDFILLLIISETTQQAMIGNDFSVTNAILAILTLVMLDVGLSLWKERWPRLDRWVDGMPLIIVDQGVPLKDRMAKARVERVRHPHRRPHQPGPGADGPDQVRRPRTQRRDLHHPKG